MVCWRQRRSLPDRCCRIFIFSKDFRQSFRYHGVTYDEEFDPDRTILSLSLEKKHAIKTSDKTDNAALAKTEKTARNRQKIIDYLKDNGRSKCSDIAAFLGLSESRTRVILSDIPEVEVLGSNRYRTYRIK